MSKLSSDMTRFVIFVVVICVIAFIEYGIAELQCGVNEQIVDCPEDCATDYCPKNEGSDKVGCSKPKSCEPACRCLVNHRRADNGTCIPTEQCPPFDCSSRPFETYNPCPPYCPSDDCSNASPDGGCHAFGNFIIFRICYPKCRCDKGYWRKNGICVPYNQCGK